MDSMRHLSTSLPTTTRRRHNDGVDLLSEFKAAALSVTNLYKSAAASQHKTRAGGYQEAIDDLLAFLDAENLGLMDGEGWRVRQWATERLTDYGSLPQRQGDEEEDGQQLPVAPAAQRTQPERTSHSPERSETAISSGPAPSDITDDASLQRMNALEPPSSSPSRDIFTFRSSHPYPTENDKGASTMDMDDSSPISISATNPSTSTDERGIRILPRLSARSRHTNHNRRAATTGSTSFNLNLGAGAGSKRKMPSPDFFDISGLNFDANERRDGGRGGGKRGKHV